jgi:hypothetical protein
MIQSSLETPHRHTHKWALAVSEVSLHPTRLMVKLNHPAAKSLEAFDKSPGT